jgi:ketosteroid isomerase-like protein
MSEDREFLEWFETTWLQGEKALHDGEVGARDVTWSDRDPVTLFGAWLGATNAREAREAFTKLQETFADSVDEEVTLVAHGVSGDLAYTAHREHTTTSIRGEPRDYVLRVTQVYRREDGTWKVVHRHADNEESAPGS